MMRETVTTEAFGVRCGWVSDHHETEAEARENARVLSLALCPRVAGVRDASGDVVTIVVDGTEYHPSLVDIAHEHSGAFAPEPADR